MVDREKLSYCYRVNERHGWTKYFPVDLLDEEGPDLELSIPDGHVIKKIMWENICRIMTACWFYPILKVIRWEATAER